MRIAFLHSSLRAGGAERTIVKLSNNFISVGNEVCIILTSPDEIKYTINQGVKLYELYNPHKKSTFDSIVAYLRLLKKTRKTLKEAKPDVLICMNSSSVIEGVISSIGLNIKVIGSERSNPYLSLQGTIWYVLKKIFANFTDGYVFQTERASKFYSFLVQRKMCVIENSIESYEGINPYCSDNKIIVAIGRLHDVKGYPVLIKAISLMPKKYAEYKLYIYGEGSNREMLQNIIEQFNLQDRVQLKGYTSAVSDILKRGCIYVLSSYHEGMPNALMEAMSYGLPCVSTDCAMGPRELIDDGVNGLLVPVGDSEKLSLTIQRLIDNISLRENLSHNAFQINDTHNINKIGGLWIEYLYKVSKT